MMNGAGTDMAHQPLYDKMICLMWPSFVCAVALLFAGVGVDAARDEAPFILERLSQTYLPSSYSGYGPKFCLGHSAAEKVAYDAQNHALYVAGFKLLHVLDIAIPSAPVILGQVELHWDATDVAVCNGVVAVSMPSEVAALDGRVQLFSAFRRGSRRLASMRLLFDIAVGVLPDNLLFTRDCSKLIVANEGTPGRDLEGVLRNGAATISVIDVDKLRETDGNATKSVETIDFSSWNTRQKALRRNGIRWSGSVFSDAIEPEYMTLSEVMIRRAYPPNRVCAEQDQKTLYVSLQENNAIAVIDLRRREVVNIASLGLKPFGVEEYRLDASDVDRGAVLKDWPIYGFFQPDAIKAFTHRRHEYIVAANEGETAWFDAETGDLWSDAVYGASVADLVDGLPQSIRDALADPRKLGRLTFSSSSAASNTCGQHHLAISRIRGVPIAPEMELVFDSKDELEILHAELFPWAFNAENPEVFCADQDGSAVDINVDTRRLFRWMERGRPGTPPKEPLMDWETLMQRQQEAKTQLEAYEALERPWDHGVWRPSNALTHTPRQLTDKTSRGSGMAPESVEVAEIQNRRLLFVGNEKGNTIFLYDITRPAKPQWQSAIYPGAFNATFAELYVSKRLVDIDPESLVFVSSEASPTRQPLLIVSGSLSGTVSIYHVRQLTPEEHRTAQRRSKRRRVKGVQVEIEDPWTTVIVSTSL